MYRGATLSTADKDLMLQFMYMSTGRVLTKVAWGNRPVPQGVSVFNKRGEHFEYMFTKDEKYSHEVDWRVDRKSVLATLRNYTSDSDSGAVFYMNEDALKIASKHMKMSY